VVETATVPKTRVAGWFLAALPGGEMEPIAGRIIEVPEDLERFEMRDARSHFIAYVPPGSVEQGRQLATTGGNGKSAPCTICHGPEPSGVGPIPGLAGRSPSYLACDRPACRAENRRVAAREGSMLLEHRFAVSTLGRALGWAVSHP